jgi:hypothetical protein
LVDSKCFQIKFIPNKFFFNHNPWLAKMTRERTLDLPTQGVHGNYYNTGMFQQICLWNCKLVLE